MDSIFALICPFSIKSISSSGKSKQASIYMRISIKSFNKLLILLEKSPFSEFAALMTALLVEALIISETASACVKSSLLLTKAR